MLRTFFRMPAAKAGASVVLTVALSLFGFQAAFGYGGGGGGGYTTPYGSLSSPNGGQTLTAGSPYQILWSAGGSGVLGVELKLSTDGGVTYPTTIVASASNSSYYYWNVPNVSTTQAKVKMSLLGTSITDTSDAVFTIVGSEPMPTTTTEPAAEEEAEEESTTPTNGEEAASVEATAPAEDENVAGPYIPVKAKVNTPTINVDKGLQPPTDRPVLCESGTLIKGSLPAVYFCGKDAKRYVFVNERAFRSWYDDFSSVITIPDATLAQIPLGGNVTYKPGVRLVKITTDPKVYAIARGGWLRWVQSEVAARALYGNDWNKMIDDVPDAFFVNYRIGDPIAE